MITIRKLEDNNPDVINDVVKLHLRTFEGFFLSFMGYGFLKQMYTSYCEHDKSDILIAVNEDEIVGFLAYSYDYSGLYKFMLKRRLILFAWYSLGAFLRQPTVFLRLIKAFLKPSEVKRIEKYVELASIGVDPDFKSRGVGSLLIQDLKSRINFQEYQYITLETDALDNDKAIYFYKKNGFEKCRTLKTSEGRMMLELRYKP